MAKHFNVILPNCVTTANPKVGRCCVFCGKMMSLKRINNFFIIVHTAHHFILDQKAHVRTFSHLGNLARYFEVRCVVYIYIIYWYIIQNVMIDKKNHFIELSLDSMRKEEGSKRNPVCRLGFGRNPYWVKLTKGMKWVKKSPKNGPHGLWLT